MTARRGAGWWPSTPATRRVSCASRAFVSRDVGVVQRIRVVLAGMPRMLRDVFSQVLADQPDMEVVGDLTDIIDLRAVAGQTRSDVAILGLHDSGFPGICTHLLDEHPRLKILGVTPDGRRAYLYELRPSKIPVGDVSPAGVLAAIREAVRMDDGDRR